MSKHRRPVLLLVALLLAGGLAVAPLTPARAGPKAPASSKAPVAPKARQATLLRKLETRRLKNVRFEEVTLPDLVRWLRTATGQNFVIKHRALAKADIDPEDIRITLTLDDVTVATLLKLALEPYDLAAQVKGNVVYVTSRVDALGKPVTHLYWIAHITWTKVDFIAPEINLRPSDYAPADEYEPERIVEDDPLSSGDAVAELLQELVAPGEWDNEGWSVRATDRYLVVRAPKAIHAKVDRALGMIASLK